MSLPSTSRQLRGLFIALLGSFLTPFIFTPLPCRAAATPVTVIIGGKTVPFVVTPYVGPDGQVWAPVDAVRLMGATFAPAPGQTAVTITGVNGNSFTVPYVPQQGHECVALQRVALALGATADWQPTTTTLTLRARLEMVRQNSDALAIYTSYPVQYQVQHIDNPNRIYVDLVGLDLAAAPAAVPVTDQSGPGGNVQRIRSGQINYNTVRITVDLKRDMGFHVDSGVQSEKIRIAFGGDAAKTPIIVANRPPSDPGAASNSSLPPLPLEGYGKQPVPGTAPAVVNPAAPVLPPVASAEGVHITNVSVKPVTDTITQVAITTTGPAKYRTETLRAPNRLAFDLAGAALDAGVSPSLPGTGSVIKAVRAGILHSGVANFGRIVVDLSRLVGFSVSTEPGVNGAMTYLINLQTPGAGAPSPTPVAGAPSPTPVAGGLNSLSGKVVVVDPGHGQQDTGALAPDGSREKDMNLAIGRKLRDVLTANGATVYMTRADDTFLPVMARPQFANAHNADFFISVHCDSSGGQNSHSGTTVYFHAQNDVCRRMASDIVNRVAEVSGIPSNGVKSDTIRFQTGFGVLRGSQMPAVLVECGYMNSDVDLAALKNDATDQHIAEGIVAGLRDFVADRSASR